MDYKAVIFDCYGTLIQSSIHEWELSRYEFISKWLKYKSVIIEPEELKNTYVYKVNYYLNKSQEKYPEIKVEKIFEEICREFSMRFQDFEALGKELAVVFRSATTKKFSPIVDNIELLKEYKAQGCKIALLSNGQRAFTEPELKALGLYHLFDVIVFSSDFGYKKPDRRLFNWALDLLKVQDPTEILMVGDSWECDLIPANKIGMKTLYVGD